MINWIFGEFFKENKGRGVLFFLFLCLLWVLMGSSCPTPGDEENNLHSVSIEYDYHYYGINEDYNVWGYDLGEATKSAFLE